MADIRALFRKRFGGLPLLVRSPGRVNLIGEHTDYNDGFVLPASVDRAIVLAVGRGASRRCRLHAADLDEEVETDLASLERSEKVWPNHLLGVVDQLQRRGIDVPGFDCVFGGDIPIGAGLSSSAAIEAGLAFALNELLGLGLERLTLAALAQRAEHEFVGVRCGIMDPFVNLFGARGHALKLDCRSLEHELLPFSDPELCIVLCDTGVRHALAGSEYNLRRAQCEAGVAALRSVDPTIRSLRDVSSEQLVAQSSALDPVVYRRCHHVLAENARLLAGCEELRRGDVTAFGARLWESHRSLREDYEVSCPELDALVEIAAGVEGVLGARMMGGGFGGCTINLVRQQSVAALEEAVVEGYPRRAGRSASVLVTQIAGATVIEA